jgi:hypothetical protein
VGRSTEGRCASAGARIRSSAVMRMGMNAGRSGNRQGASPLIHIQNHLEDRGMIPALLKSGRGA